MLFFVNSKEREKNGNFLNGMLWMVELSQKNKEKKNEEKLRKWELGEREVEEHPKSVTKSLL